MQNGSCLSRHGRWIAVWVGVDAIVRRRIPVGKVEEAALRTTRPGARPRERDRSVEGMMSTTISDESVFGSAVVKALREGSVQVRWGMKTIESCACWGRNKCEKRFPTAPRHLSQLKIPEPHFASVTIMTRTACTTGPLAPEFFFTSDTLPAQPLLIVSGVAPPPTSTSMVN